MIRPDSELLAAARRLEEELPRRLNTGEAARLFSGNLEFLDTYMIDGIPVEKFEALGWLHPALGIAAIARWTAHRDSNAPSNQQRQAAVAACALGSCLRLLESVASRLSDSPSNSAREMLEGRFADLTAAWALARTALSHFAKGGATVMTPESSNSAAAALLVTALELQSSSLQLATVSVPSNSPRHLVIADWDRAFVQMHASHGPWQNLIERVAQGLIG